MWLLCYACKMIKWRQNFCFFLRNFLCLWESDEHKWADFQHVDLSRIIRAFRFPESILFTLTQPNCCDGVSHYLSHFNDNETYTTSTVFPSLPCASSFPSEPFSDEQVSMLTKGKGKRETHWYDHGKSCSEPLDTWQNRMFKYSMVHRDTLDHVRCYKRPCASLGQGVLDLRLLWKPNVLLVLWRTICHFLCLFSGQLNPSFQNDGAWQRVCFQLRPFSGVLKRFHTMVWPL